MKKILLSTFVAAAFAVGTSNAQLVTNNYAGNGSAGFGGAVGNGSLQIVSDNLGALNFTYSRGTSGGFNDAIVIYFDSISGGASSTSGFTDSADGLRRAISGFNGTDRSTLNFSGGFGADFALALNNGFAGLWNLSTPANFSFLTAAGLAPTGSATASSYTFSLNVSNIGLTAGSGQSFTFFTSYISETAFRSTETFGAAFSGSPSQGYNTFDAAGSNSFTTVPEPSTYALLGLTALALGGYMSRRRARK